MSTVGHIMVNYIMNDKVGKHNYQHKVLEYNHNGELWYIRLYNDEVENKPFRAFKEHPEFATLDPDQISSTIVKSKQEEAIIDLIEFEIKFKNLQGMDMVEILNRDYVHSTEFGKFFNAVLSTEMNAILYGPGGYGKSDMSVSVFNAADITEKYVFIKSFGEGLSETGLLGGMDMKAFTEVGKLQYLIEQSFINKEIGIFEEMLDAPPIVLLALKDILTSGMVRQGNQVVPIKTRIILGLTNIEPEIIATDGARAALLERFPARHEFVWTNHSAESYTHLIRKIYGGRMQKLKESGGFGFDRRTTDMYISGYCALLGKLGTSKTTRLSPRIAIVGFDAILTSAKNSPQKAIYDHFENLQFIVGFKPVMHEIEDRLNDQDRINRSQDTINTLSSLWKESESKISSIKTAKDAEKISKEMNKCVHFSGSPIQDAHTKEYQNIMANITGTISFLDSITKDLALSAQGVGEPKINSGNLPTTIRRFMELQPLYKQKWNEYI